MFAHAPEEFVKRVSEMKEERRKKEDKNAHCIETAWTEYRRLHDVCPNVIEEMQSRMTSHCPGAISLQKHRKEQFNVWDGVCMDCTSSSNMMSVPTL